MWGNQDDEMERGFRGQFEQLGDQILFRRNGRGQPVVVTAEEVEQSVATYQRRLRILMRVGVAAPIIAIMALVVLDDGKWIESDGAIWILLLVWIVPFLVAFWWAWSSSTDQFDRRTPVGSARTRAEIRAKMLSEWSWNKILWPTGLGLVLTVSKAADWPPKSIDDWMWFSLGAILLLLGAYNAILKWRIGRY